MIPVVLFLTKIQTNSYIITNLSYRTNHLSDIHEKVN